MSDDFIDKEEQNEENIPTPENGHSDYKPTDTKNTGVKHQLSGMYQNWFLDYASYVILERAVPHIMDGLIDSNKVQQVMSERAVSKARQGNDRTGEVDQA